MIIFGTRGITTTPERGEFFCPACAGTQPFGLKRVRRFFTLYFIPLIPLDKIGEYVECGGCRNTWNPDVRDYDPNAGAAEIEAGWRTAIRKVMIHMLLADGVVDDAEVDTASEIHLQITGDALDPAALRNEIAAVQQTGEDFSGALRDLQGSLNDEGKEIVLKAALFVALADGEFQEEEQDLLARIGSDLGMSAAHIKGVVAGA